DAPKVQRLRVRSADRVFDVKQGLMATGPKGPAVLAHQLRSAEKQDPVFPGTPVDLFQNLPVGVSRPRALLARPEARLVPLGQRRPPARLAFANDMGNIPAGIPGLLLLGVPQQRARQSYRLAQDVRLLQHGIDVEGLQLDGCVLRVSPGPVELFGSLRK